MPNITIEAIEIPASVRRGRYRYPIIKEEIYKAVLQISMMMRNTMVIASPNVFGELRTSWQTDVQHYNKSVVGQVFSSDPAAFTLERGAKQHMPPVNKMKYSMTGRGRRRLVNTFMPALMPWVMKVFNITSDPSGMRKMRSLVWFIGRKFKKHGMRKKEIYSKALRGNKPHFEKVLIMMNASILRRIKKG